jgi:hypothetical protein
MSQSSDATLSVTELYAQLINSGIISPASPTDQLQMPSARIQVAIYTTPGVTMLPANSGAAEHYGKLERRPY